MKKTIYWQLALSAGGCIACIVHHYIAAFNLFFFYWSWSPATMSISCLLFVCRGGTVGVTRVCSFGRFFRGHPWAAGICHARVWDGGTSPQTPWLAQRKMPPVNRGLNRRRCASQQCGHSVPRITYYTLHFSQLNCCLNRWIIIYNQTLCMCND